MPDHGNGGVITDEVAEAGGTAHGGSAKQAGVDDAIEAGKFGGEEKRIEQARVIRGDETSVPRRGVVEAGEFPFNDAASAEVFEIGLATLVEDEPFALRGAPLGKERLQGESGPQEQKFGMRENLREIAGAARGRLAVDPSGRIFQLDRGRRGSHDES